MVRKIQPAWNWSGFEDNGHVISGQQEIDGKKIYEILGLAANAVFEPRDDPLTKIRRELFAYRNSAYPAHNPAFAGRLALIQELHKRTKALFDGFNQTGIESYEDIERSISRGLGQKPSADTPEKGYISREIAYFREVTGDLHQFAKLMDIAAKQFPSDPDAPPKGRPAKMALVDLIQNLAIIYEDHTKHDAYAGFAADPATGEYDSAFFRFAWEIISKYDPSAAKTNNALGSQIRKALSDFQSEVRINFVRVGPDVDIAAK